MSHPERLSLLEDEVLLEAQEDLAKEIAQSESPVAYLNLLLRKYSQPDEATSHMQPRSGEMLYSGDHSNSEAARLLHVARSIMLDREGTVSTEADAFFRGSLLATHLITSVTDTEKPGRMANLYYRNRLIKSAPVLKVETEREESPYDIGDSTTSIRRYPAPDSTPNDEHALSEDYLIRQTRISQSIQSSLYSYTTHPAIDPSLETVAQRVSTALPDKGNELYPDYFKMGYRFIVRLYSDQAKDEITSLLDEFTYIPHYETQSEPSPETMPLTAERAELINALIEIKQNKALRLNRSSHEDYRSDLSDYINEYLDEHKLLTRGSLIEFTGTYGAYVEVRDENNDIVQTGEHIKSDKKNVMQGVFSGLEVMNTPTEKSIAHYLESNDDLKLMYDQYSVTLRLEDVQSFYVDRNGKKERHPLPNNFSITYYLPIHYRDCDIQLFNLPKLDESSFPFDS